MMNLLKAEFYKLFHSWYFGGILLFNLGLSSVLLLDSKTQTSNIFFASLYNTPLLYFLIIVFSALFVGNDFAEKTLHQYVSAGHKRGQIFLAKMVVYQIACQIILILPILFHEVFGEIYLKESIVDICNTELIAAIGIAITAMCMLPVFFAFLFQDIGKSLVVPMLMFLVMIFLLNGKQVEYATKILPMGQLRLVALQGMSWESMGLIGIDLLWIFILYLGAYYVFKCSNLQ